MVENFSDHAGLQDGGDDFQGLMSISNTRFNRRTQLIRTEAEEGGTASLTFDALLLFFLLPGIISERSFAFGASTPWNRAIDTAYFPHTLSISHHWWSASPYVGSVGYAWLVDFGSGGGHLNVKSNLLHVRLMRGGQ